MRCRTVAAMLAGGIVLAIGCSTEPGIDDPVTLHDRILFMGDNETRRLVHMNPDGTDRQLIPIVLPRNFALDPEISPDGTQILFAAYGIGGRNDVFVVNADGTDLVNLTSSGAHDIQPTWSPDGQRIAFSSTGGLDGDTDVFVMELDGTGLQNVTNAPGVDVGADWSPDGAMLVFDSDRVETGFPDIYVVSLANLNTTRLTNEPEDDIGAEWSPDGSRIAFESQREGTGSIYMMNADGSSPTVVPGAYGNWPHWSPDGARLTFSNGDVYVGSTDGSDIAIIGRGSFATWGPASPDRISGIQRHVIRTPSRPTARQMVRRPSPSAHPSGAD